MAPTFWSNFLFPPTQKSNMFNISAQDAVNVSWTTPSAMAGNFVSLELRFWWSAPWGADFDPIGMQTVSLNGSKIFLVDIGPSYPAAGYFDLAYLLSNGSVISGPGALGFAVNNYDSTAPGRLFSQNGTGPIPANVTTASATPTSASVPIITAAHTSTATSGATAGAQTASSVPSDLTAFTNDTSHSMGPQMVAGIALGLVAALLITFTMVIYMMRRKWKRQLDDSLRQVRQSRRCELDGTERCNDMVSPVSPDAPVEKDGRQKRSELAANQHTEFMVSPLEKVSPIDKAYF